MLNPFTSAHSSDCWTLATAAADSNSPNLPASLKLVSAGEGEEKQVTYSSLVTRFLVHAEADVRAAAREALRASLEGVDQRYVAEMVLSWIQDCVTAVPDWNDVQQTLVSTVRLRPSASHCWTTQESLQYHLRFLTSDPFFGAITAQTPVVRLGRSSVYPLTPACAPRLSESTQRRWLV